MDELRCSLGFHILCVSQLREPHTNIQVKHIYIPKGDWPSLGVVSRYMERLKKEQSRTRGLCSILVAPPVRHLPPFPRHSPLPLLVVSPILPWVLPFSSSWLSHPSSLSSCPFSSSCPVSSSFARPLPPRLAGRPTGLISLPPRLARPPAPLRRSFLFLLRSFLPSLPRF